MAAKGNPKSSSAKRGASAGSSAKPRNFGVATITAGIAALGIGAAFLGLFVRRSRTNPAEHAAPDLALDKPHPGPHDRAPDAFRPDPTAPVPEGMRDSLRPATGPAPGFAADRGSTIGV
ncbi:hypothetical protein [uncultured Sphingomonas sp.]|jgi:hypothetical protein|uniref:hypothetical protein n=1 Tax=uncultured Sphingomonas sp. TaxID=158754 RepID=UPI0035CB6EB6